MSTYCVVCKKLYVPGDCSSSFHCFPKNNEQRTKWMQIIGIASCPQSARVCSDHFESSSYHPNDDYRSNLKKLLSNAVPSLKRKTVGDVVNLQASSNNKCFIIHLDNTDSTSQVMIPSNENVQRSENNVSIPFFKVKEDHNDMKGLAKCSPVMVPDSNVHPKFVIAFRKNVALKGKNVYEDSFYWPNKNVYSTVKQDSMININFQKTTEVENSLQQSTVNDSINNVMKRDSSDDVLQVYSTKKLCSIKNENCEPIINKKIIPESNNEFGSDKIDNGNLKKKRSCENLNALLMSVNKFKWKDGTTVHTLTRQDFTSDRAWNDFLRFTVVKRKQREALQRKCSRRDKNIIRLKDTIKTLKKKESKTE